jgi:hypothetical protein
VVGLVASAGCLDRTRPLSDGTDRAESPESTTTPTTATTDPASTPATVGTTQSVGDTSVTVSNVAGQGSVLYLDSPDSMAVATPDDGRYVLATVAGSESGPPPGAFALVVDGDRYRARPDVLGGPFRISDRGPAYDPSYGTDGGWVAFVVPSPLDAHEGRIVVADDGETAVWRLDESTVAALRRPTARFELRAVEIPGTVTVGEPVSVRVAAENVSEVPGVFRGVLNVANLQYAYAPYPFALETEPGEVVVWEKTFDETPPEGVGSVGFFLETVAGGTEVRATVRGRNEPTHGPATTTETTAAADAATPPTTDS